MTRREKTLFLTTVSVALTAVLYAFVAEPIFTKWRNLNDEIRSKKNYIVSNRRLLKMYKTLEDEYVKFPTLGKAAQTEEMEIADTLKTVEKISQHSNCRIQNLKPLNSKRVSNYRQIFFEVTAEGSMKEFAEFLYNLETSEEMLRVKRFAITSSAGPSDSLKGMFLISKLVTE